MTTLTRRGFLAGGIAAAAGLAAAPQRSEAAPTSSFSFVHITDTHIQPELGATEGVHKAFSAVRALPKRPAFALIGGDLVMDAAAVPRARADMVYDLWRQEAATLGLPLHYSIGNHDLYDLNQSQKPANEDPDYGKGMWKKRLGLDRTYASFDYQEWRFITLDSVGITPANRWEGSLDPTQLNWLDDLLRKTPRTMPLVFLTHFPIFTIFAQYSQNTTSALSPDTIVKNGKTFKEMIQKHNVRAVFQGHTHVVEECNYLGTRYITGGAVCGDWWKGPRLGVHAEGFVVATVSGSDLSWRYVPYGWKARNA
jgi:3',5'-cyclic AMP phosphodiesterase CpdA